MNLTYPPRGFEFMSTKSNALSYVAHRFDRVAIKNK